MDSLDHPLRKLRTSLELTLRDMAKETGLSPSQLSRIENRKQEASLDLLRQVAALAERRKKPFRMEDFLAVGRLKVPQQ